MTLVRPVPGIRRLGAALLVALCGLAACARPKPPIAAAPHEWFTLHRWPAGGSSPFGVAVADFNEDGLPDLAVSFAGDDHISLLLGTKDGGFVQGQKWFVGPVSRGMVATDVNQDGHVDLVVASVHSGMAVVFLGDGHGGARVVSAPAGLAPFNVAVGDLNGDGNPDIVVANESNTSALLGKGVVSVLLGDGSGAFTASKPLTAGSFPADVQAADLDGDGKLDLAVVNWDSHDVSLFFGNGDGTFRSVPRLPYDGPPAYSIALAKLHHDALPDIVVGDVIGRVHVLHNDGGGHFSPQRLLGAGAGLRCVIVADVNGDGLPDIVTANVADGTVTIRIAKPEGGFAPAHNIPVGVKPRVVAAADLNHDGKLDLVVTNSGTNEVTVLINNGLDG